MIYNQLMNIIEIQSITNRSRFERLIRAAAEEGKNTVRMEFTLECNAESVLKVLTEDGFTVSPVRIGCGSIKLDTAVPKYVTSGKVYVIDVSW